jgi:hypothetical protein
MRAPTPLKMRKLTFKLTARVNIILNVSNNGAPPHTRVLFLFA